MLGANSCTDDITLEPDSLISVSSFWKTSDDARGGLYGMYNIFREEARYNLNHYGFSRAQLMVTALQNASFRIKYYENTMDADNADLDWERLYRVIDYANLVLKFVPDIDFTDANTKNSYLAQAHAMRAFSYFIIAKTWGDAPIVTEPIEGYNPEALFISRSPVADVFTFIKNDIETALSLFPANDFSEGRSNWTKPATNMLKGDVYLWTGKVLGGGNADITTALDALNAVEAAPVSLLDDFSQVFAFGNKKNEEIIFSVHFNDLEGGDNYFSHTWINGNDLGSPSIPQATKDLIGSPGGFNWWAPTELTRSQFTTDDLRKDKTFLEVYSVEGADSTYLTSVVLKGKGFSESGEQKFFDDVVIYRYGELLLLKAEAKNALGMDPSEEINKIRMRAYGENFAAHEFVNGSQEENDAAILQERLFELIFEGKRWWDLIRFDKAFELVPSLQGRDSDRYLLLWPLTQNTLSLNSKLVQNPGY